MVLINYAGREINAKIVYYGPGLSGKTTNLECIYASVPTPSRGKMVSMKTRQDRTLFFDFLPLELGEVHGFRTRFLLYTVPGQVFYNATRKLVLKGADAVVFVADSGLGKMPENLESLNNLAENLREQGLTLETLPFVIQYNKRDLPQVHSVEELQAALNPRGVPSFEAAAASGKGVYETLHAVSRLLFQRLMSDLRPVGSRPGSPSPVAAPPAGTGTPPLPATAAGGLGTTLPSSAGRAVTTATPGPATPVAAGPARGESRPAIAARESATGGVAVQQVPTPRPAPPELLDPSPWQEGQSAPQFAVESAAGGPQQMVQGRPRAAETETQPPAKPPAEYPQYGHVVDFVHSEPAPAVPPADVATPGPGTETTAGFIKDPLRRAEKPSGAPGRSGAPSVRPTRTQHFSVVLSEAELRPGGTIRIVLDLQVEP